MVERHGTDLIEDDTEQTERLMEYLRSIPQPEVRAMGADLECALHATGTLEKMTDEDRQWWQDTFARVQEDTGKPHDRDSILGDFWAMDFDSVYALWVIRILFPDTTEGDVLRVFQQWDTEFENDMNS
jgi:hypothetical protein